MDLGKIESEATWETLGIELDIADKWIAVGIHSPETVRLLMNLGVSPESIRDGNNKNTQDQL